MIFSRAKRKATIFLTLFWVCAVLPYFAIATFAQGVLEAYGLTDGLAGGVGLTALATVGSCLLRASSSSAWAVAGWRSGPNRSARRHCCSLACGPARPPG